MSSNISSWTTTGTKWAVRKIGNYGKITGKCAVKWDIGYTGNIIEPNRRFCSQHQRVTLVTLRFPIQSLRWLQDVGRTNRGHKFDSSRFLWRIICANGDQTEIKWMDITYIYISSVIFIGFYHINIYKPSSYWVPPWLWNPHNRRNISRYPGARPVTAGRDPHPALKRRATPGAVKTERCVWVNFLTGWWWSVG